MGKEKIFEAYAIALQVKEDNEKKEKYKKNIIRYLSQVDNSLQLNLIEEMIILSRINRDPEPKLLSQSLDELIEEGKVIAYGLKRSHDPNRILSLPLS